MRPTAKSLILDLLSANGGRAMPVRALVTVARLFEITENNLRVALARLLSRGVVARDERGRYRIAAGAAAVQSHVASWARVEDGMVPWRGGWIGVHAAGLSGRSRAAARRRALDFLGFRELGEHLWVRPDNLRGGVAGVRARLRSLGLEGTAPVFAMAELDADTEARARSLWNTGALRSGYREMRAAITRSTARLPKVPIEAAMTECFILGGEALRRIAFDPLLPEPILPGNDRHQFIEAMRQYDRVGRGYWWKFMREHGARSFASPMQLHALDAIAPSPVAAGSNG